MPAIEKILENWLESGNLRAFTFMVHLPPYLDENIINAKKRINQLRRSSTRERAKAGKDAKERDLDYAQRVIEFLKVERI